MIKLLVMSTLNMDEKEFVSYACRNAERVKQLSPDDFISKIYSGEKVCVKYDDGTVTTYEMIEDKELN